MPRKISVYAASLKGTRKFNEDVELFKINISPTGSAIDPAFAAIDYFMICDGHGGKAVANFVAPLLAKHLTNNKIKYPLSNTQIFKIYDDVQNDIINHPKRIGLETGTTAIVVVRYCDDQAREFIQVINLGDCRAIVSKKGFAMPLTKDHKPFWSEEKKRIDAINKKHGTNHKIHFEQEDWRIHDLSVSRAFGDLSATPHVTHHPESFVYQIKNDIEFIVLACDGLWDSVQNHEVVNYVRDHLDNNYIELYNIGSVYPTNTVASSHCLAKKLASYAIARGSHDNVSVIVVVFDNKS
jgi:serine/threonine protein phosphatase PrpC